MTGKQDKGVQNGRPGGLSSDDGAASVSTLRASIPDAEREFEPEPQIDNSFTGLQARQRQMFSAAIDERDRLRSFISTLYVNAARAAEKPGPARGSLISFISTYAIDVANGMPQHEAIRGFEQMSKCSACGIVPGILGNGLCFDCAPEGQWPAQAMETRRAGTEGSGAKHDSAVPEGDAPCS